MAAENNPSNRDGPDYLYVNDGNEIEALIAAFEQVKDSDPSGQGPQLSLSWVQRLCGGKQGEVALAHAIDIQTGQSPTSGFFRSMPMQWRPQARATRPKVLGAYASGSSSAYLRRNVEELKALL